MKNIKRTHFYIVALAAVSLLSCSKEFLEKPPIDTIVDASFYKTNDQVLAATGLLYSKVWFDYNDKASYNLGDFRAGTAYSAITTGEMFSSILLAIHRKMVLPGGPFLSW